MQYQVEVLKIDKQLSHELKIDYEMKADKRLSELKGSDICGANYQVVDNAYGYKVIFKSGQFFEELIPTVTSTNTLEIKYDCAFGLLEKIAKPVTNETNKKGKKRKKPRNNTFENLTYFKERDLNGEYIAVALRVKNPKCKGYNKYKTLNVVGHIDVADLAYFQKHRMRMNNKKLVITSPQTGKNEYVSRLIMARIATGEYDVSKLPKGLVVDHKDRNPLNNREFNLRLVTPMENALNTNKVDFKIKNNTFYGLGVKKIGDLYQVKAYKITNNYYEIADMKYFEDLAEGQAWKSQLEAQYLKNNIDQKDKAQVA